MRLDHTSKANIELAPGVRVTSCISAQRQRVCDRRATESRQRTGRPQVSGGDIEEATPDPIPNSEVKLLGADGTARATLWESRTLPGFFESPREKSRGLSPFVALRSPCRAVALEASR